MTLKRMHRILLCFLVLMPIFMFLIYVFMQYRNDNSDISLIGLFNNFRDFLYYNLVETTSNVRILPDFFRSFILSIVNIFSYNPISSFGALVSNNPFIFVVTILFTYEIIVLVLDLIFNVFRWFIMFIQRQITKFED